MATYRTSYFRRGVGGFIGLLPIFIVGASFLADGFGIFFLSSVILGVLALLMACHNFWLSFIHPTIWQLRRRKPEDYPNTSGVPLLGTLLCLASAILGFGYTLPTVMALAVLLLDTGGLPWFVICTWKDRSLWDKEIPEQST